jgi:hypothetical protein
MLLYRVLSSGPRRDPSVRHKLSVVDRGVGQDVHSVIPTLAKGSWEYLCWLRSRPLDYLCTSMPKKKWRFPRSVRANLWLSLSMRAKIAESDDPMKIMPSTYIRINMVMPDLWNRNNDVFALEVKNQEYIALNWDKSTMLEVPVLTHRESCQVCKHNVELRKTQNQVDVS